MKLKKLNARGFSHDIILIVFVMIFAIAGVAYLVASHADSPTSPATPAVTLQEVVAQDAAISSAIPSSTIIPASTIVTQAGVNELTNVNKESGLNYVYVRDIKTGQNFWLDYAANKSVTVGVFGNTTAKVTQISPYPSTSTPQYVIWPDGFPGFPGSGSSIYLRPELREYQAIKSGAPVIPASLIETQYGVDQLTNLNNDSGLHYEYAQDVKTGQNVWIDPSIPEVNGQYITTDSYIPFSGGKLAKPISTAQYIIWPGVDFGGFPGLGSTVTIQQAAAQFNAVYSQAGATVIPASNIVTQWGVNMLTNVKNESGLNYEYAQDVKTGQNVWIDPSIPEANGQYITTDSYIPFSGGKLAKPIGTAQYIIWPGVDFGGFPGLGSTVTIQQAVAQFNAVYSQAGSTVIPASNIVTQWGVNMLTDLNNESGLHYEYAQDVKTGQNVWIDPSIPEANGQYITTDSYINGNLVQPIGSAQYVIWPEGFPGFGLSN